MEGSVLGKRRWLADEVLDRNVRRSFGETLLAENAGFEEADDSEEKDVGPMIGKKRTFEQPEEREAEIESRATKLQKFRQVHQLDVSFHPDLHVFGDVNVSDRMHSAEEVRALINLAVKRAVYRMNNWKEKCMSDLYNAMMECYGHAMPPMSDAAKRMYS